MDSCPAAANHEKVIEYSSLIIDSKTLRPYREIDIVRFVDGKHKGTFQNNIAPIVNGVDPDKEIDQQISELTDEFHTSWDNDDVRAVHFTLRTLGLYLHRR